MVVMVRENKRMPRNFSSIQISKKNKDKLQALALTPRESYENIILRLLNVKLGNRCIEYMICDKDNRDCSVVCVIDWGGDSENIKFMNGDGVFKFRLSDENIHSVDCVSDEEWECFVDGVNGFDNLINNLAVLDYDESMVVGDFVLKRLD